MIYTQSYSGVTMAMATVAAVNSTLVMNDKVYHQHSIHKLKTTDKQTNITISNDI